MNRPYPKRPLITYNQRCANFSNGYLMNEQLNKNILPSDTLNEFINSSFMSDLNLSNLQYKNDETNNEKPVSIKSQLVSLLSNSIKIYQDN